MLSCETAKAPQESKEQKWEEKFECRWLPNYGICVCQYKVTITIDSWYDFIYVPDHVCDGEEDGAIPL
jgi:hypothetical protein